MGRTLPPRGRGRWAGPQPPGGKGACCCRAGAVVVLEAREEQQAERICSAADLRLHQGAADSLRDLAGGRRRRRWRAQNRRSGPGEGEGGRHRPDLVGVVRVPTAEEKLRAPWAKGGAERRGRAGRRGRRPCRGVRGEVWEGDGGARNGWDGETSRTLGMRSSGGQLQNATIVAAPAGAATVCLLSTFCRCRCSYNIR
jgi:hypothetical protein